MGVSIVVRTVAIGETETLPDPIRFSWSERTISVRELIEQAVSIHVELTPASQTGVATIDGRSPERRCVAPDEIERMSALGRIRYLSVDKEMKKAVDGFRNGRFLVLVDGKQMMSLDEEFAVREKTDVEFVRLVPLKGG
jgi:hypothetical protein